MTPAHLRAAYASSVVELSWPGGWTVLRPGEPLGGAALPAWSGRPAAPVHVVTAWNPRSRVLSDVENARRDVLLRDLLRACGIRFVDALGRSEDGAWREPSVALLRTTLHAARSIARRFDQHAIFVIDADGVRVVDA